MREVEQREIYPRNKITGRKFIVNAEKFATAALVIRFARPRRAMSRHVERKYRFARRFDETGGRDARPRRVRFRRERASDKRASAAHNGRAGGP